MEKTEKIAMPHQVIMQNRSQLELSGVTDVDSFDDTVVLAYTSMGELTVRGQELHIRRLDLEGGSLSLEGRVDSLTYADTVKKGGFFSRLLR